MVQCCQCDVAWRVLDAQFFGVSQRRRRIFLVADFGTGTRCAEKILFEPKSLPGDTAPGKDAEERTTAGAATSTGNTSTLGNECILNDQGRTLQAQERGHQPIILDLTHADEVVRYAGTDKTQTLNARMGTGGNQTPVIQTFCIAGNVVDRKAKQNGTGISKGISSTLNTVDKHAVCIGNGQINQLDIQDKAGVLNCMHDKQIVAVDVQHIRCAGFVRRLMPLECERLQGLPDNWTLIPGIACPDSKRYKAIGNGMAQPCADFILRRLMRNIKQEE